jgi:hypothetical protein
MELREKIALMVNTPSMTPDEITGHVLAIPETAALKAYERLIGKPAVALPAPSAE